MILLFYERGNPSIIIIILLLEVVSVWDALVGHVRYGGINGREFIMPPNALIRDPLFKFSAFMSIEPNCVEGTPITVRFELD